MLTVNADAVQQSILKARQDIEVKLKNMVAQFASETVKAASSSTPIGNAADLAEGLASGSGSAGNYARMYLQRKQSIGIAAEIGFHAGAWQYDEGGLTFNPTIRAEEEAVGIALQTAKAQYKVGDSFRIGATGPAYKYLQQEIETGAIPLIYAINLKELYR